ncbi:YbaN family protein [Aureimonas mangrovi]|uniref:YbaN family protein n=1 Tax=Aureimonas mangrovi TaxID=2758041 RepID=UPI00163D6574|nr:YbaN family protein [Aureimonas mangrovi]
MASRPARLVIVAYRALGSAAVALAAAGVVLPGLPTTPFLLVAVWAFGRSSPELAERLRQHPRFGPALRDWQDRRAVPRRAKVLAVVSMAASFALLAWSGAPAFALAATGAILLTVAAWLVTRPNP